MREIARVLRPGAPFVYVGAHPCWVGPHSTYDAERGYPELHPGWYRRVARYMQAPGVWRESGVRIRVGAVHIPLGLLLQTFLDAGLRLSRSRSRTRASTRTALPCAGGGERNRALGGPARR